MTTFTAWQFNVSVSSFKPDQHSKFVEKSRRQNFDSDQLEDQNKCINSLERQEKAAESNI